MDEPKPVINVDTTDNKYVIANKGATALRKSGATEDYVAQYIREVTESETYENLVNVLLKYFEIEEK